MHKILFLYLNFINHSNHSIVHILYLITVLLRDYQYYQREKSIKFMKYIFYRKILNKFIFSYFLSGYDDSSHIRLNSNLTLQKIIFTVIFMQYQLHYHYYVAIMLLKTKSFSIFQPSQIYSLFYIKSIFFDYFVRYIEVKSSSGPKKVTGILK